MIPAMIMLTIAFLGTLVIAIKCAATKVQPLEAIEWCALNALWYLAAVCTAFVFKSF